LHTCCCIVFVCLNSNLCLNSNFVSSLENSKGFLFPSPANPALGPAPNQTRGPALRSPVGPAGPLHRLPPCLAARWGPTVITFTSPEPAVRPHRAAPRLHAGRAPAPPSLGPHAQATRDAYKSRRHLLPYPFRPYPRSLAPPPSSNPSAAAPLPDSACIASPSS
jgi:hypothetical protein